jgi:hypothetical protein
MGPEPNQPDRSEYLAKVVLTGIFLAGFALFVSWRLSTGQGLDAFHMTTSDLVLLVFATLRMGRMLAYDLIMEPLRAPFTQTVPDGTGAGDSVEPKGRGMRRALGQLISCPICAGTWSAGLLVLAMYAWPGPARILITVMGVIGAAEVLNAAVEGFSWSGQLARTRTGAIVKSQAAEAKPAPSGSPAREPADETEEEPERVGVSRIERDRS